jgi:hypothetical protein
LTKIKKLYRYTFFILTENKYIIRIAVHEGCVTISATRHKKLYFSYVFFSINCDNSYSLFIYFLTGCDYSHVVCGTSMTAASVQEQDKEERFLCPRPQEERQFLKSCPRFTTFQLPVAQISFYQ